MKVRDSWMLAAVAVPLAASVAYSLMNGADHRTADVLTVRVVDEATLRPVRGAFVCVGQKTDHNNTGFLDAYSGITDSRGKIDLPMPEGGGKTISVGATGYVPWYGDHRAFPNDPGKVEVALRPSGHTFDYWGQFAGGNVSGIEVRTMAGGPLTKVVADANGMFYLPLDPTVDWWLTASSEFISERRWKVDLAQTYTFNQPEQVRINGTTHSNPAVYAVLESGGFVPVDNTAAVEVARIVPGQSVTAWEEATPVDSTDPAAGWSLARPLDQAYDYVLLTRRGTHWGAAIIEGAEPGQPQVVLQDTGTALLAVNVLQGNDDPVSGGNVILAVNGLGTGKLAGITVQLTMAPAPSYGQVAFTDLPAGTYSVNYKGGFETSSLSHISVGDGEIKQVEVRIPPFDSSMAPFTHDHGGTGGVNGMVTCPNGVIAGATVMLLQGEQLKYMTTIDDVGAYEVDGIMPGSYLLGASGVSADSTHLYQLAGTKKIGVSANQDQTVDLELYAPPCIRVIVANVTRGGGVPTAIGLIEGALVTVDCLGTEIASGHTNSSGSVFFYDLPAAELDVSASLKGYTDLGSADIDLIQQPFATLVLGLGE